MSNFGFVKWRSARLLLAWCGVLVAGLVVVGCSGGVESLPGESAGGDVAAASTVPEATTTSSSTTTTTSSTTTTTSTVPVRVGFAEPGTVEADVEAAYLNMREVELAAFAMEPMDVDWPPLDEVLIGPAREEFRQRHTYRRDRRDLLILNPDSVERVQSVLLVDDGLAFVEGCGVDRGKFVNADTGAVVDGGVGTAELLVGFVLQPDGVWKAESFTVVSEEPGVVGCALDFS